MDELKTFVETLVGKTIRYDDLFNMTVKEVRETPWSWTDEDGDDHTSYSYAISENGWSWYIVGINNVEVI